MTRRDLLAGAAGASLASMSDVAAARSVAKRLERPFRLGILLPVPGNDGYPALLREGLRRLGWYDDAALVMEIRQADGTVAAFRRLGAELASLSVDVLVTASTAAADALKMLSASIPIVFVGTFDPVAAGLVAHLDRPGGNLTGIAGFKAEIGAKWVTVLKELAPGIERVKLFVNPASIAAAALTGWKAAASQVIETEELRVDAAEQIDRAIGQVARDSHAGIIVVPHTFPFAHRNAVVAATAQFRVPAIYGIAEMVRSGGLISYGQNLGAQWRMAAIYVDKIARGVSPAVLPVRYAGTYNLALNRGAAAQLGLPIPPDLLKRADELIG